MELTLVAKQPDSQPAQPSGPDPDMKTTTWKAHEKIARILRKIQAYVGGNQESVLDLFEAEFDNYLATLQAEDMAKRKKRQGQ